MDENNYAKTAGDILCALICHYPGAFNSKNPAPYSGPTVYKIDWDEVKKAYTEIYTIVCQQKKSG